MKKITLILVLFAFNSQLNAQIGSVNFIDTSIETAGITKIISRDLNTNGFNDVITSTTGTNGRFGYYLNQTNNTFGTFTLIDNFEFCRGIAVGNFNEDSLLDFVVIGKSTNESRVYLNSNGTYVSSLVDTNSMILNEVVVANFDQNNSDDFVVIGQHSIDFYRNNGSGVFTKEEILTTSTSPVVLECLDLEARDIDDDGDIDLISGETAGVVVYTNDGNGIFTPHYYSLLPEIITLIHLMDVDDDEDLDIVCQNSANQLKWFSNNGSGVMTYEATISGIPTLKALNSVDYNNDGLEDLYVSYTNHISVFANNENHTFSDELILHQTTSLIMGQLAVVNIDNQNLPDYVWSGGNNTLAFHLNQSNLALNNPDFNTFTLFPNPTNGILNFSEPIEKVILYNTIGAKLMQYSNVKAVDLSNFSNGVYIIQMEQEGKSNIQKIIKK